MLFYFRTLSLWVGAMPVVEDVWVRGSLSKFWSGPWLRWRLSIFSLYEVSTVNWQYFSFLGSQGGGSGVVVRTILSRYLKTECNSPYTPSTLAPYCASSCRRQLSSYCCFCKVTTGPGPTSRKSLSLVGCQGRMIFEWGHWGGTPA